MSRLRCNACLGEYDNVSADGVRYFHVCPPVTMVTVRAEDGAEFEQPLRAFKGITIAASDADKKQLVESGASAKDIVVELARRQAPRKDARDEHTLRREGERGEKRILKSEGKGVTAIAAPLIDDTPVDDAL